MSTLAKADRPPPPAAAAGDDGGGQAVRSASTVPLAPSGLPLAPGYGPDDLGATWSEAERLGDPGAYPFTRGPYPTMYRGKPWTMRMFAGFGTPEDTNRRFKFLLSEGQTGL